MSNTSIHVRAKRWAKFLKNYLKERVHGLDFSMVYVGDLQRNVEEFHGYSMTDADDMKRMLGAVPVDPRQSAFLDVGCGKGMCLKCAVEMGYKKVAGLDLDEHLLGELFEQAGFETKSVIHDTTRDTITKIFY